MTGNYTPDEQAVLNELVTPHLPKRRTPTAEQFGRIVEKTADLALLLFREDAQGRIEATFASERLRQALDATKHRDRNGETIGPPLPELVGWPKGVDLLLFGNPKDPQSHCLLADFQEIEAHLATAWNDVARHEAPRRAGRKPKPYPPWPEGLRERFRQTAAKLAEELTAITKNVPTGEDKTAYRPAKEMVREPDYPDLAAVRKALRANPWVRTRRPTSSKTGKPIPNRREIHAGDWHKMLHERKRSAPGLLDLSDKDIDAAMRGVAERKEEERRRKEEELSRPGRK
jgi:hypothetical protein